jgi:hypothetical protein
MRYKFSKRKPVLGFLPQSSQRKAFSLGLKMFFMGLIALMTFAPMVQAGRVLNDALATRPFRNHVWQSVLIQRVNANSEVDLAGLRANPRRLNAYLEQLESVSPENHPDYFPTRDDVLAYWLNAHNALAMRLVLDRYPTDSITDWAQFENLAWYRLGGKPYSLQMLQQKIARFFGRQPDALFAVTDYTLDSSPILPEAYESTHLSEQLERAKARTRSYVPLWRVDRANSSCAALELSPFLKTYETILLQGPPDVLSEDRDALDPDNALTGSPINWVERVRPWTAAEDYADLGLACQHSVVFRPENRTLRQVKPL